MTNRLIAITYIIAATACPGFAAAQTVDTGFDRWMYPFNASPGGRPSGSTFNAILNPQFDDHDAQVLIGFDTASAGIPAGAGATNYQINAATVLLSTATDAAFMLDPTYDPFGTYLDETTDEDPGRPVELYGVGFRNGYQSAGVGMIDPGPPVFGEADSFGPPGPLLPANGNRNAYASDHDAGSGRDVSNHVRDGYDPKPWAIGNVPTLNAGDSVPIDTPMEFALDLSNADLVQQLQSGLDGGGLFFAVVSKHDSVQGSNEGVPSFHLATLDGASLGQRAQVILDYQIVPEPSGLGVLGLCAMWVIQWMRRGFRHTN